jgi:hypothetical protein
MFYVLINYPGYFSCINGQKEAFQWILLNVYCPVRQPVGTVGNNIQSICIYMFSILLYVLFCKPGLLALEIRPSIQYLLVYST